MNLRLDWVDHKAAKYACDRWHYSGCVPKSKQVKIGVWEDERFCGVIIYGNSSGSTAFQFLGLDQFSGCELTRIALRRDHKTQVSRIISISLKMLHRQSPGIRAVISFADTNQGHHGGVYQGSNWKYFGRSTAQTQWFFRGKWRNDMSLMHFFKGRRDEMKKLPSRKIQGKHKYVYFFDKALESMFIDKFVEYPKRDGSIEADAPCVQQGEGGSTPTPSLQTSV